MINFVHREGNSRHTARFALAAQENQAKSWGRKPIDHGQEAVSEDLPKFKPKPLLLC